MNPQFISLDELPAALNAKHIARIFGISRSKAYELLHSEGFPTLFFGKQMVVPRDHFFEWLDNQLIES